MWLILEGKIFTESTTILHSSNTLILEHTQKNEDVKLRNVGKEKVECGQDGNKSVIGISIIKTHYMHV